MKRGFFVLVLVWALVSTALLVVKSSELQKTQEELAKYKTYALENSSKLNELLEKVNYLEQASSDYKNKYFELSKKYGKLKLELDRKNYTIAQLKRKIAEFTKIPLDYYNNYFGKHNNTPSELINFTLNLTIPENLTFNQKIAYLEWALRNAGFNAHIVYGEIEDGISGNESIRTWIVVFLDNGTYYVDIPYGKIVVFNATEELEMEVNGVEKKIEYEPMRIFKDIYSVVNFFGNVDDWDWWNVVGFPPTYRST